MFIKVGNRHIFGQKFLSHQIFFGGKKCPKTVKKWEKFPNIEAWIIFVIVTKKVLHEKKKSRDEKKQILRKNF